MESERERAFRKALEKVSVMTEEAMQILLAQYPDLLLSDKIYPSNPRRWLLVAREMPIPGNAIETRRWSLDHFFLDQDGVPTFVECKRAIDRTARREVVSQMLEYVANGVEYWSMDRLRQVAKGTAQQSGKSLDDAVRELVGEDDADIEQYWKVVEANLCSLRLRLVFVMDRTPKEVHRLVEFLNRAMSPIEVLAVDIKQFQGKSPKKKSATKSRSLSPTESKLILRLESSKQLVVTIEQAMEIVGCSYNHARQILHRLARNGWLARITAGRYEFIPAERGEHAFPDTNPLFIGSTLVKPYYFSFATAAFFYGLSTQASATVYIATTVRKGTRLVTVRDKEYRLVVQPAHKFFGMVEVDAYGSRVMMAEPEKTVLDSLDRPVYTGDIPEVAAILWRGKGYLDWNRLAVYAVRFKSQAILQRLGYLSDVLNLPLDAARDTLLASVGKSTLYLGRPGRWGTGGTHNAVWQIVDNIPRRELMCEIEIY